jgi:hypothetical protein
MLWKKAKALPPPYLGIELFNAQFRIQREAIEAAGHYIPMIVENVKGAQKWVGRARWHYGSFYLWGDVPALMPITFKGFKTNGMNWSDQTKRGQDFTRIAGQQAIKNNGGSWFNIGSPNQKVVNQNPVHEMTGVKLQGSHNGSWFGEYGPGQGSRNTGSHSLARKRAQAMIAKIPYPLAEHISKTFKPVTA